MNFYRTKMKLAKPKYSTLFDGIDYKNLDQSLLNFLKYLVNYGFYRFGLEVNIIATINWYLIWTILLFYKRFAY